MSRKDRKQQMVAHLKREILTCARPAGADLDEAALSTAFDLSRTPVRDVLRELAQTDQIDALMAAQDQFRQALRTGGAAETALANVRFHEITGEMAANAYLLPSFGRLLIDHARIGVTFYRPRSDAMAKNHSIASDQHDQIIAALRDADEARAAELAIAHWDLSRGQMELFVMPQGLEGDLGQRTPA